MAKVYVFAKSEVYKGSFSRTVGTDGSRPTSQEYNNDDYCALYFSNNPSIDDPDEAEHYVEGTVGMTEFPGKRRAQTSNTQTYQNIPRSKICNVKTFGIVEMPEDCTGLFSNFSFGFSTNSYGTNYGGGKGWFDEANSAWVTTERHPSGGSDYRKTLTIDFSGFDFSHTKKMTSLFENSLSNTKTISSTTAYYDMGYTNGVLWRDWDWGGTDYGVNKLRFAGLDAWDTSNVEDISRMFANINGNTISYDDPDDEAFVVGGINTFHFPKVTNAANLFAGSNINFKGVKFEFGSDNINFSFAFSNYSSYNGDTVDLSIGAINSTDGNLQSMFRNIKVNTINLGSVLNNLVSNISDSTALNYMFANDGSSSVGTLKTISVKGGTDWHIMNANLGGYKMFVNQVGLPNFVASNNDINYANNTRITGYFDQAPPEKVVSSFIKKKVGSTETGLDSDVFIKKEDGWKPVTGVYI